MAEGPLPGWLTLVHERFPPAQTVPPVIAFVLGNAGVLGIAQGQAPSVTGILLATALAILFFLRLRLFDEIKDLDTDRRIHPERPLQRGVIAPESVKRGIYVLAAFELALASLAGPTVLATYAMATAYSFLMYREFFIGEALRPYMTTYAVMHTFVVVLLGHAVAAVICGRGGWALPRPVLQFGLANWAIFNLFEFARKTYAPSEEREDVATYSSLFRPAGAGLLSLSQVVAALGILGWLAPYIVYHAEWLWHLALAAGLVAVPVVVYIVRPGLRTAKLLRGLAGTYILGFYALLAWQLLGRW